MRFSILLVEDDPGDARLIREMLAEASHVPPRLTHVASLAGALECLRQRDIDVVLLDLGLPDSQGLETFIRLRAAAPRLPVVVLSGHTDTTLALGTLREGAQDYLLKGHVDPEVLVRALRYAIEHKRIEEHLRYLAEASRALAGSLDYETTIERVVRLPVPLLAEACVLRLHAEGRSAPWLVVHDLDRAREGRLREANGWHAFEAAGQDPELGVPAALQCLGFNAWLVVPLAARGRALGTLALLRTAGHAGFSREEAELFDELALRSALALDNARLCLELQVAVRLRDDVLAAAVHDLLSPLSGIKLRGAQLRRLLSTDPTASDAELHERVVKGLVEIDAAVARSVGLIQELVDAASLQAGQQLQLDLRPTDLVTLTHQVVAEHQARSDSHRLRFQGPEQPLVGNWDAARLRRVLDNLLSNAVKYSPRPGTITVALTQEADAAGDWTVLQITDHGLGIPATEVRHVFDRFFRGSNVPREIRGAGIGLSGVRQVVEQHAGSISVESQEGTGTTFTIRLPLTDAPCVQSRNDPETDTATSVQVEKERA